MPRTAGRWGQGISPQDRGRLQAGAAAEGAVLSWTRIRRQQRVTGRVSDLIPPGLLFTALGRAPYNSPHTLRSAAAIHQALAPWLNKVD